MKLKTFSKLLVSLSCILTFPLLTGCGGAKPESGTNPNGAEVPKVSLVQGDPSTAKDDNQDKAAQPDKIPDGAFRVSVLTNLLGAHYCAATVINEQKETTELNVGDFSEAYLGLSPLFCNVLRQAFERQSNLTLVYSKPKDAADKLLDLYSIEFPDNAKPETGNLAFLKCETDKMGCGSNTVRIIGFTAKSGADAEEKLCELTLEVQEDGQRKTIPAYIPWSKGESNSAFQQTEVQTCSSAALAKQTGKRVETIGTLERPGGLGSDRYRLYALILR